MQKARRAFSLAPTYFSHIKIHMANWHVNMLRWEWLVPLERFTLLKVSPFINGYCLPEPEPLMVLQQMRHK